jgi:GT2 family glycosyltransferase
MQVTPSFLETYVAELTNRDTVVVGRVFARQGWRKGPMYEAMREYDTEVGHGELASGKSQPNGTHFVTQNVGFSRQLYLDVGGFDPELKLAEDSDLGWRFEKAGAIFKFSVSAYAVHHSNIGNYHTWLKRQYEYGKYIVYIWEKSGRDIFLHPLRNYVNGNQTYPTVFRLFAWNDWLLKKSPSMLLVISNALKGMGLFKLGLFGYRAQKNIQFHRGVMDALGGTLEQFKAAEQDFRNTPNRPTRPLGDGPVFRL